METGHPAPCPRAELPYACVLQALPASELAAAEAHIAACPDCRRELASLRRPRKNQGKNRRKNRLVH